MRLIFLTNFYPPASMGGYEQWCQEVAAGLKRKGHEIIVLTSDYQRSQAAPLDPDWVHRELNLEMELRVYSNAVRFFAQRKKLNGANVIALRDLLKVFHPQGACVWGMWNLNRSLLESLEQHLPGRVVYYMGDYWPFLPSQYELYWKAPGKNIATYLPKKIIGWVAHMLMERDRLYQPRFEHVLYPSAYLMEEYGNKGLSAANSRIVYGAIDTESFDGHDRSLASSRISLLYAGRLEQDKGVHTAVQAAHILVEKYNFVDFHLKIVGNGDGAYKESLHQMVKGKGLETFVTFQGQVAKEMMPELYSQADVFLFTSIWQEPFGRVLAEAMASGVVAIGTATGGSAEILADQKTGLVYPPGDAQALAEKILLLSSDHGLYQSLSREGRRFALDHFSNNRMVNEIEEYFKTVLEAA